MVWLQALLGLIVLLVAGDLLVRGAVNFSLKIKIPSIYSIANSRGIGYFRLLNC
jgi:Ca2+/Na+ antiporter